MPSESGKLCNIGHIHCSNGLSKGRASDCIADWVQVCLTCSCGPDVHRLGGVQPDPESLEGAGPGESSFHIPYYSLHLSTELGA